MSSLITVFTDRNVWLVCGAIALIVVLQGVIVNRYYCGRQGEEGAAPDCGLTHATFQLDWAEAESRVNLSRIKGKFTF